MNEPGVSPLTTDTWLGNARQQRRRRLQMFAAPEQFGELLLLLMF